jgi:hypothetical protein
VIGRGHFIAVKAHQVWHHSPDTALFVIEHYWRTASHASTKFKWAVMVIGVKRLAVQVVWLINLQLAMFEEHHMGRWLAH